MVTGRGIRHLPPYVSYRTFRNFIDTLQQGIPSRIDRSYWGDKWSGSTGMQLMAAVRFLGLADNDGVPTDRLRQLVQAKGPQRTDILKRTATETFSFVFRGSFDPQTATYSQLEEAFRDTYQVTGQVATKCLKFFMDIASDAGIPLSPFVVKKKTPHTTTATKRAAKKAARTKGNDGIPPLATQIPGWTSWDRILVDKFPTLDPAWTDEVKAKWFDAFGELLKKLPAGDDKK
ncbi:MAG: DUF5343 domain-containing protein [Chloroflexota bacterium]